MSIWRFSWRYPFIRKLPRVSIGDLGLYAAQREPMPFEEKILYQRWVVVKGTDIVGVVDHIKPNGQLGVRPIDPSTGAYCPNASKHWNLPDRLRIPEEWALYDDEVRNATEREIPKAIRKAR